MITTAVPLTLFLAKVLGGYMIFAGISGFTSKDRWENLILELRESAALSFITGVVVYVLGASILYAHHHWTDPMAIIVTLLGWGGLIEGALFLAIPKLFMDVTLKFFQPSTYRPFAAFAVIGGIVLMICASIATAGPPIG